MVYTVYMLEAKGLELDSGFLLFFKFVLPMLGAILIQFTDDNASLNASSTLFI